MMPWRKTNLPMLLIMIWNLSELGEPSKALFQINKIPNSLEDDDVLISKAFLHFKEFKSALSLLNDLDPGIVKKKMFCFIKNIPKIN